MSEPLENDRVVEAEADQIRNRFRPLRPLASA